jgi:hypothetical protein
LAVADRTLRAAGQHPQGLGADRFDDAFSAGSELDQQEAVAAARDWKRSGRGPARSSALP